LSDYDIRVILDEMDKFTPETGYDLVMIDWFSLPGDKLSFIKHFDTREEAEKEQKNHPGSVIYTKES